MSPIQVVDTEQRCSFSKLQEERVASRCIKPRVVLANSVHVLEREALGARDHHGMLYARAEAFRWNDRLKCKCANYL